MNPDRLTVEQRACLLRAARRQLEVYTDALAHLVAHGAPDAQILTATAEIQCVQAAIRWLWRDQRTG